MKRESLSRVNINTDNTRQRLLPFCRLKPGQYWEDPDSRHIVGCGDACNNRFLSYLFQKQKAVLAIHDPPYNHVMFKRLPVKDFIAWCRPWIDNTWQISKKDASLYIWMGADQKDHFQPLPQFMTMMADTEFLSRSFITMRNQRGYGTQKNWMAIRQELLYYTKGKPVFNVQYTDIPKILRGYYKQVGGEKTENLQRSKSTNIRSGNVWVDIQQVFYRMPENVNGCYAQKPLKAIERIILASSEKDDIVTDFFAHSGTTLIGCERTGRRCITLDIDPIYAEISIRRLERYRQTGKTGWQTESMFEKELSQLNSLSSTVKAS